MFGFGTISLFKINLYLLFIILFIPTISIADSFDYRSDIYDFFVQDVCLIGDDVDTATLPHNCANRRNMRTTDNFYYRTHARYDDSRVQFEYGNDAWSSYPVIENGVRRIVLLKDNGKVQSSGDSFGIFDNNDGVSIRWMGSSTNSYGFLLFTASPNGAGFGMTSHHCSKAPDKIARYYDNWIHGPKDPTKLELDKPWGVSTLVRQINSVNPDNCNDNTCDKRESIPETCGATKYYKNAFHFAVRTKNFRFTNNRKMETIVHQKFSIGSSSNKGPTIAKTFERIYLTREYGVTRWEQWEREDKVNFNKSSKMLISMTSAAARKQRICTPPYNIASNPGTGVNFRTGSILIDENGYYEKYKDTSTGEGYKKWYLVACVDVTGKILTGNKLLEAYEHDENRINNKPNIEALLNEVSDPDHELFNLFF